MTRKFTKMMAAIVLLTCLAVPMGMWGQTTSTTNASKVTSSSFTWTSTDENVSWSGTVNGGATNQNMNNGYAQIGTKNSPSNSVTLSTSSVSGTITSVILDCASYNGLATVSATVGGTAFGTQSQSSPSWSDNSGGNVTFTNNNGASGEIIVTMTNGTGGRAMYIKSIAVTYTSGPATYTVTYNCNGGTSGCPENVTGIEPDDEITLADAPSKTGHAFDGWNDGTSTYAAGDPYTVTENVTMTAQWTAYTINAQSSNASYGSVSLSGNTITATPNSGYRVIAGNGGYTITAGTATVANNGDNTFSVTPESDCTVQINFEAIPAHTATFSVNGTISSMQVAEGAAITFPADPANIDEMVFMGWANAAIDGTTDTPPTFVTSATMGNSDVTFYAVFASVTPGTATTVTDELTRVTTGVTSGSTTYSNWSGKKLNSDAVYAGNSAGGNNSIQLRTNNSNSGVVTTTSGGKAKKVTISWNSNTSNGRILDIYGKNSAYSAASELYNTNNQGTKLGSVTYGGNSTVVTITDDYNFIGMRSNDGAMYITSITIEWESISPDTYSDYCTTVEVSTDPSVTVTPSTINAPFAGADGSLAITYKNITEIISFDYYFCDANGDELEDTDPDYPGDWIYAEINEPGEEENYTLSYIIDANSGAARTAYIKVYTYDDDLEEVYAIVTVNQEVAPEPSITIDNSTVNVDAEEHDGTLDLAYESLTITDMTDFNIQFCDANGDELSEQPDWIEVLVAEQDPTIGEGYVVSYYMVENEGTDARTAYFKVYAMDDETNLVYSNLVTISQAAYVAPPTPGNWVLTNLADLTSADVFVIVGNGSYAIANDGTSNPLAVNVTVSGNTLSGTIADNIQWNISGNNTVGYTFYPAGSATTWLYCNTTTSSSNNTNMRVGNGGSNNRNKFEFDNNNQLSTKDSYTKRYLALNGSSDWRGYVSNETNTTTIAFYKKVSENVVSYTKEITGHGGNNDGGWNLIASPVASVTPSSNNGFIASTNEKYDLYYFDQTAAKEWKNYKANSFNLVSGQGYLYANENTVTLTFEGQPYNGNGIVSLTYSTVNEDENMRGWNLIGNPFSTAATLNLPFFKMNGTGSGFTSQNANSSVAAMEGVLVYAYDDDASQPISTATFTAAGRSNSESAAMVNIDVVSSFGDVMDNAIVNFNEGIQLPKFYFGTQNANIYIPQGNKEYAVVSAEAQGEMPVNFKAAENGTYTLTVTPEGVEMNYLHLIDNMTGADIDLLAATSTGSVATYTFNASTTDYSSRFRLVFAANNEDGVSTGSTAFAFYSNGTWVINNTGEATLQVVDVNGRILSSETVNGSVSKAINASAGVYMLRLINGNDVKTQKIVVR